LTRIRARIRCRLGSTMLIPSMDGCLRDSRISPHSSPLIAPHLSSFLRRDFDSKPSSCFQTKKIMFPVLLLTPHCSSLLTSPHSSVMTTTQGPPQASTRRTYYFRNFSSPLPAPHSLLSSALQTHLGANTHNMGIV
jgi:hypothetical protein